VTYFGGVEHKFVLPTGQLTTLLETKDLLLRASPFDGEAADEQWIERIVVDSAAGERVVEVAIRHLEPDTINSRSNESPGSLATLEVTAPWWKEGLLTFPTNNDDLIDVGTYLFSKQHYAHPHNVSFDIFRVKPPQVDRANESGPTREGILITSDSLKVVVMSTPAFEYYWEDDNAEREIRYAHLDFDLFDMKGLSSFNGLLPEVWGIKPAANQPKLSTTPSKDSSSSTSQSLKSQILANMLVPDKSAAHGTSSRGLTKQILEDMLFPGNSNERTSAGVCGKGQCSPLVPGKQNPLELV